jgi:alpha-tubulin suppressor-like RCC1 family protein
MEGSQVPVPISGNLQFKRLYPSEKQVCGITLEGSGYCWGENHWGELGIGSDGATQTTPQPIGGGLRFIDLAVGLEWACGVSVNHNAYCWGDSDRGVLGIGDVPRNVVSLPTRVLPAAP